MSWNATEDINDSEGIKETGDTYNSNTEPVSKKSQSYFPLIYFSKALCPLEATPITQEMFKAFLSDYELECN